MQSTQEDILRIPLSNTHARDRLYWKENKVQQFTVRTTYRVARMIDKWRAKIIQMEIYNIRDP